MGVEGEEGEETENVVGHVTFKKCSEIAVFFFFSFFNQSYVLAS